MQKRKHRPDYSKLYPGTPIDAEVAGVLVRSDRKMEYQERDIKRETWKINHDAETVKIIPSREDSLDRLLDAAHQFPQDSESVEDTAEKTVMLDKLRLCLELLAPKDRELIDALFFENDGKGVSETTYANRCGVSQQAVNRLLHRVLRKLINFLEN